MVNNCLCDNELLLGLKAGNQKSFSDIYEKYWKNLYNSAYKRLKNNEKSKDVVQNVFTSLWDRRQEVTIHNLSAYLHTSVKFQVYKQAIKAPQVAEFLEAFENILVSPVNTEDDVLEKEILSLIKAWIEALPPKRKKNISPALRRWPIDRSNCRNIGYLPQNRPKSTQYGEPYLTYTLVTTVGTARIDPF